MTKEEYLKQLDVLFYGRKEGCGIPGCMVCEENRIYLANLKGLIEAHFAPKPIPAASPWCYDMSKVEAGYLYLTESILGAITTGIKDEEGHWWDTCNEHQLDEIIAFAFVNIPAPMPDEPEKPNGA